MSVIIAPIVWMGEGNDAGSLRCRVNKGFSRDNIDGNFQMLAGYRRIKKGRDHYCPVNDVLSARPEI